MGQLRQYKGGGKSFHSFQKLSILFSARNICCPVIVVTIHSSSSSAHSPTIKANVTTPATGYSTNVTISTHHSREAWPHSTWATVPIATSNSTDNDPHCRCGPLNPGTNGGYGRGNIYGLSARTELEVEFSEFHALVGSLGLGVNMRKKSREGGESNDNSS